MTEQELDLILTLRWPSVVRHVMASGSDPRLMDFVRSISRQGKRKSWRPSRKQEAWMRAILADFKQSPEPDIQLIEE